MGRYFILANRDSNTEGAETEDRERRENRSAVAQGQPHSQVIGARGGGEGASEVRFDSRRRSRRRRGA